MDSSVFVEGDSLQSFFNFFEQFVGPQLKLQVAESEQRETWIAHKREDLDGKLTGVPPYTNIVVSDSR